MLFALEGRMATFHAELHERVKIFLRGPQHDGSLIHFRLMMIVKGAGFVFRLRIVGFRVDGLPLAPSLGVRRPRLNGGEAL